MTHIITSLCLRDGGCVDVCPVECIIPGKPETEWPLYYIDPDTCIDCGACIDECPFEAIFTEEDVPSDYSAKGGERISRPGEGTEAYEATDCKDGAIKLDCTRTLDAGETVDLTPETQKNYDYFTDGPGYDSQDSQGLMDN